MLREAGTSTPIEVRRIAGYIGAEMRGVDLSMTLSEVAVAEVRSLLMRHKVLFFRNQRLTHGTHVALGRQFGSLCPGEMHGAHPEGFPELLAVDPKVDGERYGRDFEERNRRRWLTRDSGWHTDFTPAVNPPAICILRAEAVPPFGGDTQWTNLVAAYEGLSEPLQKLADGLRAEHVSLAGIERRVSEPDDVEVERAHGDEGLVSVHPVVRVHPETGEKALFVQPGAARRIIELTALESRRILELFFEQITRPEYTVRFRWEVGDVAIWDNRATAHLAATDLLGHSNYHRSLYRVTVLGERPVGPDGFQSESVVGDPLVAFNE